MANQESIIELLYLVREELQLRLTEYEWPKKYQLDCFDYEVRFKYIGFICIGRGLDKVESVAIEKAASEAIERLISQMDGIDTVGISVGITYDFETHAKHEVLERHYLNHHLKNKINFTESNFVPDALSDFRKNNAGFKIQVFRMQSPDKMYGFGCLLTSNSLRSVGFALGSSESEVVSKAFFEALPNLEWLSDELPREIDKPWHLKDDFLNQLEALIIFEEFPRELIDRPCLEQVKISTGLIPFLRDSKVNVCRYTVAIK